MSTSPMPESTALPESPLQPPQVQSCNFRYAGRLSNENSRAITVLGERFAASVAIALEAHLGAAVQLKLQALDQASMQDHLGTIAPDSYLVPCALGIMESSFLIQMDAMLVFPLIDLLLGGTGSEAGEAREMTDIDEEIMHGVASIFVREIERCWHWLHLAYALGHCLKAANLSPHFSLSEKVVILLFEMSLGERVACFRIVLPTSFVGYLLRHQRLGLAKMPSDLSVRPSLRRRMLDCRFVVSADMKHMRVLVKDLLALAPGNVLTMKAPVKRPGHLTLEDVPLFEAAPVRSGTQKAAQLLLRSPERGMNPAS